MNRDLTFSHLSMSAAIRAGLNNDTGEMRASLDDSNHYLQRARYNPVTAEPNREAPAE